MDFKPQVDRDNREKYMDKLRLAEQEAAKNSQHAKQESMSESEDSVQVAQQRNQKTGISDATMAVIEMKNKDVEESRAASKERQTATEWKRRAQVLGSLAEQVRLAFTQGDANTMALEKLVKKIVDPGRVIGQFRSRGKCIIAFKFVESVEENLKTLTSVAPDWILFWRPSSMNVPYVKLHTTLDLASYKLMDKINQFCMKKYGNDQPDQRMRSVSNEPSSPGVSSRQPSPSPHNQSAF